MTLQDFNALTTVGKSEQVDLFGDFLTERVEQGLSIHVYRLHNFYVEAYRSTRDGRILRYRACSNKETVCNPRYAP